MALVRTHNAVPRLALGPSLLVDLTRTDAFKNLGHRKIHGFALLLGAFLVIRSRRLVKAARFHIVDQGIQPRERLSFEVLGKPCALFVRGDTQNFGHFNSNDFARFGHAPIVARCSRGLDQHFQDFLLQAGIRLSR